MKNLNECKEYYKDVFLTWLDYRDNKELEAFENILRFIYGKEFEEVEAMWKQEALNEYYGAMAKAS